jgi:16S rRNA G527 N7-methylase RsmG
VTAQATRVEDFARGAYDIVISRAFSDSRRSLLSARHLAPDGLLVAMKGVHPDEELASPARSR